MKRCISNTSEKLVRARHKTDHVDQKTLDRESSSDVTWKRKQWSLGCSETSPLKDKIRCVLCLPWGGGVVKFSPLPRSWSSSNTGFKCRAVVDIKIGYFDCF